MRFPLPIWYVPIGLFALVAAVMIITFWRGITLPRRAPKQPACARCRYPIGGAASLTCPECGADLRECGITTPRMELRRRTPLMVTLAAWTVLVTIFSLYAWDQARWRLQVRAGRAPTSTRMLNTTSVVLTPRSGAYTEIGLYVQTEPVKGGTGEVVMRSLFLMLYPLNDASGRLVITGKPGDLRCSGDDTRSKPLPKGRASDQAMLSRELMRWLGACNIATTDATIAEAGELARLIHGAFALPEVPPTQVGGAFTGARTSSRLSPIPGRPPTSWLTKAFAAIGATLWLSGGIAIVLRRRAMVTGRPGAGDPVPWPGGPVQ